MQLVEAGLLPGSLEVDVSRSTRQRLEARLLCWRDDRRPRRDHRGRSRVCGFSREIRGIWKTASETGRELPDEPLVPCIRKLFELLRDSNPFYSGSRNRSRGRLNNLGIMLLPLSLQVTGIFERWGFAYCARLPAESLQMICPCLHHLASLGKSLGAIVSAAAVIALRVGELQLDQIWMPALLIEGRRGHGSKAVCHHLIAAESQPA